jgi:2-methylcitrate dehydratase PrpD
MNMGRALCLPLLAGLLLAAAPPGDFRLEPLREAIISDARAADPAVLKLAAKVSYVIDPDNEYPRNYSGHIRVETVDGRQIALDQPHMRGGVREPLTAEEIRAKAIANCRQGGWDKARALRLIDWIADLPRHPNLAGLAAIAT